MLSLLGHEFGDMFWGWSFPSVVNTTFGSFLPETSMALLLLKGYRPWVSPFCKPLCRIDGKLGVGAELGTKLHPWHSEGFRDWFLLFQSTRLVFEIWHVIKINKINMACTESNSLCSMCTCYYFTCSYLLFHISRISLAIRTQIFEI